MLEIHSIYLMECPDKQCKKQFKDEWKLKRHLESNRDHPTLKYQFNNFLDIMKIYVDISLFKPGFKCPLCDNYYLQTYDLLHEHCKAQHNDFNLEAYFFCKQCGQLFRNNYKLKAHIFNVHSGKKKAKLTTDNLTSETDNAIAYSDANKTIDNKTVTFNMNEFSENTLNERMCHICNKVLKDSKKYQKHVQSQHGINENGERLIECPICERNFFNRQQLERHMRIHETWVDDINQNNLITQPLNTTQQDNNNNIDIATANNNFAYAIDCWLSNASLPTTHAALPIKNSNKVLDENNNNLPDFSQNVLTGMKQNNIILQELDNNNKSNNKMMLDYRTVSSVLYCYECDKCKIFFKSNKLLFKHKRLTHKLKPVYKCLLGDECGLKPNGEFDSLDEFINHSRIHSQKNIYCTRCKETFDSKILLRNHMKNVHYRTTANEFNCNYCKIKFKTKAELTEHNNTTLHRATQKTKNDGKSNQNNETAKTASLSSLQRESQPHNQFQSQQKQQQAVVVHKCFTCLSEFPSSNSLHNHMATHDDLNLFLCEICKKAFKTRKDLSTHATQHDYSKNKTCSTCFMTFKTAFHLKRHELTRHSNLRPFKCDKCEMTFARKDKLKQHQAKHVVHPIYQCCQCGKGFYRKEHLKDHEISKHSKQYPFTCENCSKGFVHAKDLYRHIRVRHLGLKLASDEKTNQNNKRFKSDKINNIEDDIGDDFDDNDDEDDDEEDNGVDEDSNIEDLSIEQNKRISNVSNNINQDILNDLILNEKLVNSSKIHSSSSSSLVTTTPSSLSPTPSMVSQTPSSNILSLLNSQNSQTDSLSLTAKRTYLKSHKCQLCDRDFFYENHLKKHILSKHTGTPLFSCSYCKTGFSTKSAAKFHVENRHAEYECANCKKVFSNRGHAQRHMLSVHQESNLQPKRNENAQAEVIDLYDKNMSTLNTMFLDNNKKQDHETNTLKISNAIPLMNQQQQQQPLLLQQHHLTNIILQNQTGNICNNNNNNNNNSDLSLNANRVRQLVQQSTALQQQQHQNQLLNNNIENSLHIQSNLNYKIPNNNQNAYYTNLWSPISQQQQQQQHQQQQHQQQNFDFSSLQTLQQQQLNFNQQQQQNIQLTQLPQQLFDVNLD